MLNSALKSLSFLLVVLLMAAIVCPPAAEADTGVTVSISPGNKTRRAGETFAVDLLIDSGATKIRGWQGEIGFDPEILECKGVTEGNFLEKFAEAVRVLEPDINNTDGVITNLAYANVSQTEGGASGKGKLCTLSFKVKPDASGITDIYINDLILADENVNPLEEFTPVDASVEIAIDHPEVEVYITTSEEEIETGGEFDVSVAVYTADLVVRGAGLRLEYDESKLICKTAEEEGNFWDGYELVVSPRAKIDNNNGRVDYFQVNIAESETSWPSGEGDICTFHMKAKDKAGEANISIKEVTILDEYEEAMTGITIEPSTVTVFIVSTEEEPGGEETETPTPEPTSTPEPTQTPSPTPSPTVPVITTPVQSGSPAASKTPATTTPINTASKTPPEQTKTGTPESVKPPDTAIPEKTISPPSTPEANIQEAVVFDLSAMIDGKGTIADSFSDEGPLSAGGDFSVGLVIDSGTVALNRQQKPLDSISFAWKSISARLPRQKDLIMVFEGSPSGCTFSTPVTIRVKYEPDSLPQDRDESALKLAVYDSQKSEWQILKSQVNRDDHTVSARISHFSTFALMTGSTGISWMIFVAGGLALIVIIAGLMFWVSRRKNVTNHPVSRRGTPGKELGNYLNSNLTDIYRDNSNPDNKNKRGD